MDIIYTIHFAYKFLPPSVGEDFSTFKIFILIKVGVYILLNQHTMTDVGKGNYSAIIPFCSLVSILTSQTDYNPV